MDMSRTERVIILVMPAIVALLALLCADVLLEAGALDNHIERDLIALVFGVIIGGLMALWHHEVAMAAREKGKRKGGDGG